MIYHYRAYGLGIQSYLPLPELLTAPDKGEVLIQRGRVELTPAEMAASIGYIRGTATEAYLAWPEIGAFWVRRGHEIIIQEAPGVEAQVLRLFVLGSGLGTLLHQRGFLVLHGSTVAVSESAVSFLGWRGSGKSTLTAAMCQQGHTLVADDVTAIKLPGGAPLVCPGYPRIKLWEDAIRSLGYDPAALPRLRPQYEKRSLGVGAGFPTGPLPLRQIYIIEAGDTVAIEPLAPAAALVELVRHSYCTALLSQGGATAHFQQCARVVEETAVRRLIAPRDLTRLPEVIRMVEKDLQKQ